MKILLIIILLAGFACGQGYDTFMVDDYRSLLPILGANVSLEAAGFILSGLTDSEGEVALTSSTTSEWNISVTRSGYQPYGSVWNFTNATKQVYLTPNSNAGIIRIVVVDRTLGGSHRACLFFSSNNRLHECYEANDTIVLHNNLGYVWRPVLQHSDMISSLGTLEANLGNYLPALEGIIVILFLAALFILIIVRFGIRGRRR